MNMFRTNRIREDVNELYFLLLRIFGKRAADRIMINLVKSRTYNIQLVGAAGVGKSSFKRRLLTNTFTPNYTAGALVLPQQNSIAFPTPTGKVVFNIRECGYSIDQPNLYERVRNEWENTDVFFVMSSHQDALTYQQSQRWIQAIRRHMGDVPIVFVELKSDRRGRYDLRPNIRRLCAANGNIPYVQVSSHSNTNIHGPFVALQDILRTSERNLGVDNNPTIPITPLIVPAPAPPAPQPDQD
jgi:GTPase SAR1 family protein